MPVAGVTLVSGTPPASDDTVRRLDTDDRAAGRHHA